MGGRQREREQESKRSGGEAALKVRLPSTQCFVAKKKKAE